MGQVGYHAGRVAEDIVALDYARRGRPEVARRWRGSAGEIDLVIRDGDGFIFVEVKKSRSFGRAAHRVNRRQMDRICGAATEYVATEPKGLMTNMRFDVALVDDVGRVEILENAFAECW